MSGTNMDPPANRDADRVANRDMDLLAARMGDLNRVSQEQEALCELILYMRDSSSMEAQIREISSYIETNHPNMDLNDGECESGYFALSVAALQGLTGVCQELLRRGADVNKATSSRGLHEGETALFAVLYSRSAHADQVVDVLCAQGADLEHVANGTTALGACSWQKNNHVFRALVNAGANVDVRPHIGQDPTLLLSAIRHARVNETDSLELVRFLCEKGHANLEILTRDSKSAYELAESVSATQIVNYLKTKQSERGWNLSKMRGLNADNARPGPIRRGPAQQRRPIVRHEPYTKRKEAEEITDYLNRLNLM